MMNSSFSIIFHASMRIGFEDAERRVRAPYNAIATARERAIDRAA